MTRSDTVRVRTTRMRPSVCSPLVYCYFSLLLHIDPALIIFDKIIDRKSLFLPSSSDPDSEFAKGLMSSPSYRRYESTRAIYEPIPH